MSHISFKISAKDARHVTKIVSRILSIDSFKSRDAQDWQMDLIATHANGCPMNFEGLLNADEFNFVHDIAGIARHLDRETGKLLDLFTPRFARRA